MRKFVKKHWITIGCCAVLSYILVLLHNNNKIIGSGTIFGLNFQEKINYSIALNRSIFFLETSHINKSEIQLTARQCCAIESAAMMNPTMKIHLLIFTDAVKYSNMTKIYIAHLTSYSNIIIEHVNIHAYMKNTVIEEWWNRTNVLKVSKWPAVHVSDILRLLTIWKNGGIYFDLDVIVKSSFEQIGNFAGSEDMEIISNGIFGFEESGIGKRIVDECLEELMTNFRGDIWIQNGPRVLTVVLKKICNTEFIQQMTAKQCHGFKIFPTSAFYPIHWSKWQEYFDPDEQNKTMNTIANSSIIHVWNKLSSTTKIKVGSDAPYALVASKYCPQIYNNCGDTF